MVKLIKWLMIVMLGLLIVSLVLFYSLSYWLPAVAHRWLPEGVTIQLDSPRWQQGEILIPRLAMETDQCLLAVVEKARLGYHTGRSTLSIETVKADHSCFSRLPVREENTSLDLATIQQQLPAFHLSIAALSIVPWQAYSGALQLDSHFQQQQIDYQSPILAFNAHVDALHLTVSRFDLLTPDQQNSLSLSGQIQLPTKLEQLPQTGNLNVKLHLTSYPETLLLNLNWLQNRGSLSVGEKGDDPPLAILPWSISDDCLSIEGGKWRWPHGELPISGGISIAFGGWNQGLDKVDITARFNLVTKGLSGKSNVVLSMGPGKVGLIDSQLAFQLTGKADFDQLTFNASIPGVLTGPLLNPILTLQSGALLRAQGRLSPMITLDEARLPLAGIQVALAGVTGRLQAIMRVTDRHWGKFKLHVDGQAKEFWPDKGRWQWNYWGNGQLPVLNAHWDITGKGKWQDTLLAVQKLSTGFDQLHYGAATVKTPRLQLASPLEWQRDPQQASLGGVFQLVAQQTNFNHAGRLPPSTLNLTLFGRDLADFQWRGELRAGKIGPIQLSGRWDGERLRGRGWWPEQSLMVFQPLLPAALQWKIRSGTLYAQMAFSAAQQQGLEIGGHWVVKQGSMWLQDGELNGLDFIMPLRLKGQRWTVGKKHPVTLRINSLHNLFEINNITASLQGNYPYDEQHPLSLNQISVDLLKGQVSLSALRLPQHKPAILKLERLDLSELLAVLKQKQFVMSGRVNGELPLFVDHPHWLIHDGWIASDNSLTLRLDQQMVDAITKDNIAAGVAMDWLRYLEISLFRARGDLDNLGQLMMQAEIVGLNTQKSRTQEVRLNYHHEENLFQLWRSLRFGDNLEEWLQKSVSLPKRGKNE